MSSEPNSNAPPQPPTLASKLSDRERIKASFIDAISGAAAGALAKTAVAPIERIKLLMQLQKSISIQSNLNAAIPIAGNPATASASVAEAVYTKKSTMRTASASTMNMNMNISGSAFNVAKAVYNEEGFIAFWRGNTPNVLRQAGSTALNFMLMDWYKIAIAPILNATLALPSNRPHEARKKRRKIISSFLSGGLAGGTTTTFLYPIEFMRTRLALDIGSSSSGTGPGVGGRMYPRGMRDVFCTIWKTDGFKGMYQGYGIALTGVVLYRAMHLGGYDACKTELLHRRGYGRGRGRGEVQMTMGERFFIAQLVSITAGTICYPIDSVRRRLMMQAGQPINSRLYANSMQAFQRIFVEEGIKGFYLGIGPNLMRSFGGALLLVSYDVFRGMV